MPSNDEKSGADPADYATLRAPSKDTSYSNTAARLKAAHQLPADAEGNAAFRRGLQQVQFPISELTARIGS